MIITEETLIIVKPESVDVVVKPESKSIVVAQTGTKGDKGDPGAGDFFQTAFIKPGGGLYEPHVDFVQDIDGRLIRREYRTVPGGTLLMSVDFAYSSGRLATMTYTRTNDGATMVVTLGYSVAGALVSKTPVVTL
jgi:hypothetical protein